VHDMSYKTQRIHKDGSSTFFRNTGEYTGGYKHGAARFPGKGEPENIFTILHLSSFRLYLPSALEN
jgi:hypothetical protein